MDPKNQKERKGLFTRFLALFILGIVIVCIPFYFSMRLPARESVESNEELNKMEQAIQSHEDYFVVRMDSLQNLIADFENEDKDVAETLEYIATLLVEMNGYIKSDTVWRADMNNSILVAYSSLRDGHKELIEKDEEIAELKHLLTLSKRRQRKAVKPNEVEDSLD